MTGIATRGHGAESSWVNSYKVDYSLDGENWFEYKERYDNNEQVRVILY